MRSGGLRPQAVREHQPAPLAASGLQANLFAAEGGAGDALPVGGGWGAHAQTAAARRGGKGDGSTPRPCSSYHCKSRSATPSCPSLPAGQRALLSRGELRPAARRRSPLEPGADVAPPLEQKLEMVRTARVRRRRRRDRRWSGASRARRRGERACSDAGARCTREVARKMRRERKMSG
jgi:hypothetical protein